MANPPPPKPNPIIASAGHQARLRLSCDNDSMRAMVIHRPGEPLRLEDRDVPSPAAGQILVKVHACGVCRTDLHVIDGELKQTRYPVVPGHEIVGEVAALGDGVGDFRLGERVGIPWLGWTCGKCRYCLSGRENLCDFAR